MLLSLYRVAAGLASPFLKGYLQQRRKKGKEHESRISERWGIPGRPRPAGKLLWMHAASVGEAQSVLPLLRLMAKAGPDANLLLTTGTVTSARFIEGKLPENAFHQFVPVDTPEATGRFIRHWQPDLAVWTESELWPNLILATHNAGTSMALINARLSERSFRRWTWFPDTIRRLLACFDLISAQAGEDALRLERLAGRHVEMWGNLKYEADPLTFSPDTLTMLEKQVAGRPVWLAASIHPGEEAFLAAAHRELLKDHPELLLILVPRHPHRGTDMAELLKTAGLEVTLRSGGALITSRTQVYIADTLGELGLFYRLAGIVFVGGSLIAHGGQNPLEAARLDCALLSGPHTHNFTAIYDGLKEANALRRVHSPDTLHKAVDDLLRHNETRRDLSKAAANYVASHQGALNATSTALLHLWTERQV